MYAELEWVIIESFASVYRSVVVWRMLLLCRPRLVYNLLPVSELLCLAPRHIRLGEEAPEIRQKRAWLSNSSLKQLIELE